MFSDMNEVKISGRLVRNLEFSPTKGGEMCRFSIAHTVYGERDEATVTYINCVAWNELAQLLRAGRPIITKGDYVKIKGSLSIRTVTDKKAGTSKTYAQIIVVDIAVTDRKNDKRSSGAGTAGAVAGKHPSQSSTYDRYSTSNPYNPDFDGSTGPSLFEMAQQITRNW